MNPYTQENEFGLGLSFASIIGIFLTILGVGVTLWVVVSIYLLFTDNSAFYLIQEMLPEKIYIAQVEGSEILVPREFFLFGVPLSAVSIGARVGLSLLKNGVGLIEKPKKKQ